MKQKIKLGGTRTRRYLEICDTKFVKHKPNPKQFVIIHPFPCHGSYSSLFPFSNPPSLSLLVLTSFLSISNSSLCHKEARFLALVGSSSTLFCTLRGTTTYKHPILRASHNAPHCSLQGISKKHKNGPWLSVSPKLHVQNKFPRDVVVRSELTAAGSAGDGYSLPELNVESKVRGACFYVVTAFSAIFLFVLMLVGHPLVLLFDCYRRKFHHFIAKVWATLTVAPFFKIEFEGLENLPPPDTPAVYVSNHQSFLDIYTLLTLGRSFKFISKTGIFLYPIIGWAMFLLGVIPLKRMDSRSQLDCLKRCMDLIKKGASVFFFPEGTRSKDGKLGTFKVVELGRQHDAYMRDHTQGHQGGVNEEANPALEGPMREAQENPRGGATQVIQVARGIEAKISDLPALVGSYGWQNGDSSFSTAVRLLKRKSSGQNMDGDRCNVGMKSIYPCNITYQEFMETKSKEALNQAGEAIDIEVDKGDEEEPISYVQPWEQG
ncbi:1-acyl-sn-glycerol-3-phosphate acyltransferase 1, chloroplastic, partial [Mucuna pruriens]